ncbi:Flp family type IVb pilin [Roseobacter ponti]|uniref:Flp pilus assembly protein, pilin Flp n=1 Tax=Roseobacter ponti TaxID=1891787 RepID=A0A858SNY3_9RHOB|nr:hypothetical protein [Roseobacter ponti]QJF50559.1 hypothetical protein G3256_04995 [Roseobacter ponti]
MVRLFRQVLKNEDGAVAVDWVVLTAAVVGLAVTLVVELRGGSTAVTQKTGDFLANYEPF